jgi:phosphomannomutase
VIDTLPMTGATKYQEGIQNEKEHFNHDERKDHLDELTIEYNGWWFNLRASNTEPVMRLNLEANDPGAEEAKKKEVLKIIGESDLSMTIES